MRDANQIAYLIAGEDLNDPLLRRQVLELLCEIKRQRPELEITLFNFLTLHTIFNHRKDFKQVRELLAPFGIRLSIIPSLVPWPIPHCKFRKMDVGYRPCHVWSAQAARFLGLVVWPVMAYYYIFFGVRIFHCRSYPPSYATILFKRVFRKARVVFDPRSDFPEENVSAGNWEEDDDDFSFWKRAERLMLEQADAVACIAPSYERAYKAIAPHTKYFLVPNNVDCSKFQRSENSRTYVRKKLGIHDDDLVYCYLGAMTSKGWNRADVYARACDVILKIDDRCRFLFIIPQHAAELLRTLLTPEADKAAIILSPPYEEVPGYLAAADYGLMFMHKETIRVGTKVGEYLAAGLPVIANENCMGASDLIREQSIGLIIGIGVGGLDVCENVEAMGLIKKREALQKWSVEVADFAKYYFNNSVIASAYGGYYGDLNK